MRILKFAAAIVAAVAALGVAAYAYFLYSPDPTPPHLSGQVQTATIQVGSRLRSYVEYIPAQLPVPSGMWLEFGVARSSGNMKVSFQAARSIG
jgi:hypothetical protein